MRRIGKAAWIMILMIGCVTIALMLGSIFGCAKNATTGKLEIDQAKVAAIKVDLVKYTGGAIKAVEFLQGVAKIAIGLPCKFGVDVGMGTVDAKDICDLYTIADNAASSSLPLADKAIADYTANPTEANESTLAAASAAVSNAWDAYNKANGKKPFVTPDGQPIVTSPIVAPKSSCVNPTLWRERLGSIQPVESWLKRERVKLMSRPLAGRVLRA